MAQVLNNPPAMQETQVLFLGQEDLLEKGMATLHGQRALTVYSPWGCRAGHN